MNEHGKHPAVNHNTRGYQNDNKRRNLDNDKWLRRQPYLNENNN